MIVGLLARRLRSRLGLVRSSDIVAHGADPTGRWDSTKAIQRAVDAGCSFTPPGRYRVSGTVQLPTAAVVSESDPDEDEKMVYYTTEGERRECPGGTCTDPSCPGWG